MTKKLFWIVSLSAALSVGAACSSKSSDDDGDGGSGGGGDSGGASGGGSGGASGGAAGSSAGGTSGDKPFGDTVDIDVYHSSIATARCDQLWKCCETEAMAIDANKDRCPAKVGAPLLQGRAGLKTAITANTLTFDGAKLAECLNKLAALKCDASQADVDALRECDYFEGKVANGTACAISAECTDGYCTQAEGETAKKCTARKDKDADCRGGDECKSGNCAKAMMNDAMGKCADAEEPKPGLCGYLG